MHTETLTDASSVNTSSDTAKLEWADSTPTAAETGWWKPSVAMTMDPTGSRRTMCDLRDTMWPEKSSTTANVFARNLYKNRERNAWPHQPPVVSHRSWEARLSATRSQCPSEEMK